MTANRLFEPTRTLSPKVADIFARERRKIDDLTANQINVLSFLRNFNRLAISGGAGTGKTMLAMQKAQDLLDAEKRVLFLCFNKNLQTWITRTLKHPNLQVETFHGITGHAINWARLPRPTVPAAEFYKLSPDLLYDSAQKLHLENSPKLFDAILVDEAQDFEDSWWVAVPELLQDRQNGTLYVFFDDNQRIYQQMSNLPITTPPIPLSDNCRNTQHIHARMTRYAMRGDNTACKGPEGEPVQVIAAPTPQEAKRELQRLLHRLVNEEGIAINEIVMLSGSSESSSQWKKDGMLGNFIVSWNMDTEIEMCLRVSSISTYKGLETSVIILTELERVPDERRDPIIYVGLSRARHRAYVLGVFGGVARG